MDTSGLISILNLIITNSLFLPIFLPALGGIFFVSLLYILKAVFTAKGRESKAFHKTVLLIKVPKEKKG